MLEWMDDAVTRGAEAAMTRGDGKGSNPLEWRYIRQIERKSQVEKAFARSRPCVMLASDASLDWGFTRDALRNLAADSKNLLIFPEGVARVGKKSGIVGRQLWDLYQTRQTGAKAVNSEGTTIEIQEASTAPLDDAENALYQQYLARQRHMHSSLQGDNTINDATGADIGDEQASESSDSSDDEETEHQGRALNLTAQLTQTKRKVGVLTDAELGVDILLRSKDVHDYDVRNKRGREKLFPFVAHKTRDDEFGDLIKPEDYLRAEERDDGEALDVKSGSGNAATVGLKRKWDDTAASKKGGRSDRRQDKRVKFESPRKARAPDAIDDLIAQATGEGGTGNPNGTVADADSSGSDESDYEPEDASDPASEGPQKVVFTTESLAVHLRIAHVDFSGLYRLNDMKSLIGNINPRKLIVIAGNENETKLLADACREAEGGKAVQGEIFTPMLGEAIDASVDTNAWTVKLSRGLLKRLQWGKVPGGLDVVNVSGQLGLPETTDDESAAKKKLKLIKGEEAPAGDADPILPVLDILPAQALAQQRTSQALHVGDLSLIQIRETVQKRGHVAELRGGGTLLIDGSIVVKKQQDTGGIEITTGQNGLALPQWRTMDRQGTFYAVRNLIYDSLAVAVGV